MYVCIGSRSSEFVSVGLNFSPTISAALVASYLATLAGINY